MRRLILLTLILVPLVFIVGCGKPAEAATSLVTDVDSRYQLSEPVAVEALSISFDSTPSGGVTNTLGTATITKNGRIRQLVMIAGDLSTSTQLSVTVVNADSTVLWTSSTFTEDVTTVQRVAEDSVPLIAGTTTININTKSSQLSAVDQTQAVLLYFD